MPFTEKKFIENTGKSPMYVGNVMVPPGEGRLIEVTVPREPVATPAAPSLDEQLAKMLDGSLAAILPELGTLSLEALDRMEDLESGGKKRKGLMDAVATERIRRADEKLQEEQARATAEALEEARAQLLKARVALVNLSKGSPEDVAAAQAAVDEAQAKVDALTPEE